MRISIQFDEYFWQKNFKILISVRFEIFTKTSHLKLVGTPCTILWQFFKIHFSIFCLKQIFGFLLPYFASDFGLLNFECCFERLCCYFCFVPCIISWHKNSANKQKLKIQKKDRNQKTETSNETRENQV